MKFTERMGYAWRSLWNGPPAGFLPDPSKAIFDPTLSPGGQELLGGVLRTGAAPRRGAVELFRAYRDLPWLRAVADRIGSSVASIRWRVVEAPTSSSARERFLHPDPISRFKAIKQMTDLGELTTIERHPLTLLMDRWNPCLTGRSARQVVQTHLDLKGESFSIIERDGNGKPIELWPIPPTWVQDVPSLKNPFFKVEFGNFKRNVPDADMLWIKHTDPANPYGRGTGIGEALADEIDTDEYASKHIKSWFYNRAVPEILVGVKGASRDQLQGAKQKWEDNSRGPFRGYSSHWHSGELQVEQLTQTFADQQLVELRAFQRDVMIHVFGVPPEILGVIENSNRATIDAADFLFSRWVVFPRLEFLRAELQMSIVEPNFGSGVWLMFENPIPADKEHLVDVAKSAPWSLKVDEWRRLQGKEPLPEGGGQFHFVPSGGFTDDFSTVPTQFAVDGDEGDGGEERAAPRSVSKDFRADDIEILLDVLRGEVMTELTDPKIEALVAEWGALTMGEVGAEAAFNMLSPLVVQHLSAQSSGLIVGVTETTKDQVRAALVEGVTLGEGPEALARRLRTEAAFALPRARTIARTEVLRSSNFSRFAAFSQSGVERHRWLATADTRTRSNHVTLHNQVQDVGKPFNVDGKTAVHPGQFGRPEEDINCRCVTVPVVPGPARGADDVEEKQSDVFDSTHHQSLIRRMNRWEASLTRSVREGLRLQQEDLISELLRRFGDG